MNGPATIPHFAGRLRFVLGAFGLMAAILLWRVVDLHVFNRAFLQRQGDARALRVVAIPAHRGMITDRNGEPLAISTPVESVWANPKELAAARGRWRALCKVLDIDPHWLEGMLARHQDRDFVYLRRQIPPALAQQVMQLKIPGVSLQREYRRYYPTGQVFANVLGFTNVDDVGQEGIELMQNAWLQGTPGSKRVIKDRYGRIVENVESISEPRPGRDLRLSLDRRIQYLAYRELKAAMQRNQAKSGSAVVLDVRTGEILAMVNQPSYNPNNRDDLNSSHLRNRALTDVFEPGSSIKPFTIAAALESGKFTPDTLINTAPGTLRVANFTIHDTHDYGLLNVSQVVEKSSNVGAATMSLAIRPERLWNVFRKVGFGAITASAFPGEASGLLSYYTTWRDVERATLAYGYGISVTTLQLAQAYAVLASGGLLRPVTFFPTHGVPLRETRVIPSRITKEIVPMLEMVVSKNGTGERAAIPGYHVAGKTGTAHKAEDGGYAQNRYEAVFAGFAPATDPRLVMVVMVDDPNTDEYYGGLVAAPVFSRVMAGALRLLDIPPDDLDSLGVKMASVPAAAVAAQSPPRAANGTRGVL